MDSFLLNFLKKQELVKLKKHRNPNIVIQQVIQSNDLPNIKKFIKCYPPNIDTHWLIVKYLFSNLNYKMNTQEQYIKTISVGLFLFKTVGNTLYRIIKPTYSTKKMKSKYHAKLLHRENKSRIVFHIKRSLNATSYIQPINGNYSTYSQDKELNKYTKQDCRIYDISQEYDEFVDLQREKGNYNNDYFLDPRKEIWEIDFDQMNCVKDIFIPSHSDKIDLAHDRISLKYYSMSEFINIIFAAKQYDITDALPYLYKTIEKMYNKEQIWSTASYEDLKLLALMIYNAPKFMLKFIREHPKLYLFCQLLSKYRILNVRSEEGCRALLDLKIVTAGQVNNKVIMEYLANDAQIGYYVGTLIKRIMDDVFLSGNEKIDLLDLSEEACMPWKRTMYKYLVTRNPKLVFEKCTTLWNAEELIKRGECYIVMPSYQLMNNFHGGVQRVTMRYYKYKIGIESMVGFLPGTFVTANFKLIFWLMHMMKNNLEYETAGNLGILPKETMTNVIKFLACYDPNCYVSEAIYKII